MSDKERWENEKKIRQYVQKVNMAKKDPDEGYLSPEEIEKRICDRLQDDKLDEYLVDGATLGCTSATWNDFDLSDGEKIHIDGAEERKKEGVPMGILGVWENEMYSDGFCHATVADTKQGHNIVPFFCNCKEPALPEQETEIKNNKADCQKNGVCKYLMDLEDEWENIDFSQSMYLSKDEISSLSYKDFEDKNIVTGVVNEGKPGIIMTSVLFCRHGGFIYPITSGQMNVSVNFQFTLEQLRGCGWETATEEDLITLNDAMQKFGITSRDSAYMMLATMLAESGCTVKIEGGEALLAKMEEIGIDKAWEAYQNNVRGNGNAMGGYNWWERGAGYMQITGQELQKQFLEYMEDPFDGKDTATYIGNTYPIESAVWYWTKVKKTGEGNLDAYVTKNGAWEGMFLVTQYFVNGFQDADNDTLVKIKEGAAYTINEEKTTVSVDGVVFSTPNSWDVRYPRWKSVEEYMNNEE